MALAVTVEFYQQEMKAYSLRSNLFWPLKAQGTHSCTDIHVGKIPIHLKINKFFKKRNKWRQTGTQHCLASDILIYLVCPLEDAVHFVIGHLSVNPSWKCTHGPPRGMLLIWFYQVDCIKLTRLSSTSPHLVNLTLSFLYHVSFPNKDNNKVIIQPEVA